MSAFKQVFVKIYFQKYVFILRHKYIFVRTMYVYYGNFRPLKAQGSTQFGGGGGVIADFQYIYLFGILGTIEFVWSAVFYEFYIYVQLKSGNQTFIQLAR